MGHRLSKIYTRTGDQGTTGLADNRRTDKDDIVIETLGAIDELNSLIGVVISFLPHSPVKADLSDIQQNLFDLGGELAGGRQTIEDRYIQHLENRLDHLNESLPPLKEFILPGGSQAGAFCHQARTVCRRAERRLVSLQKQAAINPLAIAYVNRLSDLLFVMARIINRDSGNSDVLWQPGRARQPG